METLLRNRSFLSISYFNESRTFEAIVLTFEFEYFDWRNSFWHLCYTFYNEVLSLKLSLIKVWWILIGNFHQGEKGKVLFHHWCSWNQFTFSKYFIIGGHILSILSRIILNLIKWGPHNSTFHSDTLNYVQSDRISKKFFWLPAWLYNIYVFINEVFE